MKLLIVGGFGFIGGNIAKRALRSVDVVIGSRRGHPGFESFPYCRTDITKPEDVRAVMDEVKPDVVINAAAISDIDFAEKNREVARQVNVLGARYLAEVCERHDARFLFFSSDAVFDGNRDRYLEDDAVNPLNYYGKTKAEAERTVLSIAGNTVVVRVSLVLGYPATGTGGNAFYLPLERRLQGGEEAAFPNDEYRTPVDVITLADSVLELSENDYRGIIHIGSTASISRYELAQRVAIAMGYDPDLIKPGEKRGADRAPRHRKGVIGVERAQAVLKTAMLGIDASIRRSIEERQ
jgi:dTDP-4-dehydrorhamnose reductase